MIGLLPRLNIHYSLFDGFIATKSLFGSFAQQEDVFYLNHARTGLRIAIEALDLPKGSKIGIVAYNCFSVMNAVKIAGFELVFIDITTDFCIDLNDLRTKTKLGLDALVVTHLFGIPNNMPLIQDICTGIPIIEDCAHAFMSEFEGRSLGTFADMAVFSLGQGKFPSIGDGGCLVVNTKRYLPALRKQYQLLHHPNLINELKNVVSCTLLNILHKPFIYKLFTLPVLKKNRGQYVELVYKHDESLILKTVLAIYYFKFNRFGQYLVRQQSNALAICDALKKRQLHVSFPTICSTLNYNCFMIPLLSNERDRLIENSLKHGVELGSHFSKSISWAHQFGYQFGTCPTAEAVCQSIVVYPCHYNLKTKNINLIIKSINEIGNE